MIVLADINLDRFNYLVKTLDDSLVGYGQEGDLSFATKTIARELAMDISNSLGPKSKKVGESVIKRDMRSLFAELPPNPMNDKKAGQGSIRWFIATETKLIGSDIYDYNPGASESEMRDAMRKEPVRRVGVSKEVVRPGRYKKPLVRGMRGKQKLLQVMRIMVGKGKIDPLAKKIADKRVGRMRATFAYAASMLGQTRIPSWIKSKFDAVRSDGAAIFDASKLNDKQAPQITFGGSAPGLIENFEAKVLDSIDKSYIRLTNVLTAIIHGYAKDWNTAKKVSSQKNAFTQRPT